MKKLQQTLLEQGCLWACCFQKEVDGRMIDYSYGYCSKGEGRYQLAVVVYFEKDYTLEQMQAVHKADYFVLVDESGKWHWYDGVLLTKVESPKLVNEAQAFDEEAMINMVILTLFGELMGFDFTEEERRALVRAGLLLHAYTERGSYTWAQCQHYEIALQAWQDCQVEFVLFDTMLPVQLSKEVFEIMYKNISVLPATSINLASSYYQLFHLGQIEKSQFPLKKVLEELSLKGNVVMRDRVGSGHYLQLVKSCPDAKLFLFEQQYEAYKALKFIYILAGQKEWVSYQPQPVVADHFIHIFTDAGREDLNRWVHHLSQYYRELPPNGGLLVLYSKGKMNIRLVAEEAGFQIENDWTEIYDLSYQPWEAAYFLKRSE